MHLRYGADSALCTLFLGRDDIVQHSIRTGELTLALGQELGLAEIDLSDVVLAAGLHDVGKAVVPHSILDKPGSLTSSEWAQIKLHPVLGYGMIQSVPRLRSTGFGILNHHERWDGQGYPYGLCALDIPLSARIISITDAFDAMTNDRLYRQSLSTEQAIAELLRESGKQFDPELTHTFISVVGRLPRGDSSRCDMIRSQLEQVADMVTQSHVWIAVADASRRHQPATPT